MKILIQPLVLESNSAAISPTSFVTGKAVLAFYAANYPAVQKELLEKGVQTASDIYGRIVFPEMNANWETHPSLIGHPNPTTDEGFVGCWRCHDDKLSTADGKHTIPQDCDNCHTFLVEDSPTPPEFTSKQPSTDPQFSPGVAVKRWDFVVSVPSRSGSGILSLP